MIKKSFILLSFPSSPNLIIWKGSTTFVPYVCALVSNDLLSLLYDLSIFLFRIKR